MASCYLMMMILTSVTLARKIQMKRFVLRLLMVVQCLRSAGINVIISSFGFMQIYLDDTNFNIYVGWEQQGSMFLYFGIPDGIPT